MQKQLVHFDPLLMISSHYFSILGFSLAGKRRVHVLILLATTTDYE